MRKLGFSTLELAFAVAFALVVVAALILVVDPLERAKQERDLRVKSDAQGVLSALTQFYLARGSLPWADGAQSNLSPALPWTGANSPKIGICGDDSCKTSGKLIEAGTLPADFTMRKSILDTKDIFFLAKGQGAESQVYACFIPESQRQKEKTGELYKIDTKSAFPQTGVLPSCPSNITWQEDDVCYVCLSR